MIRSSRRRAWLAPPLLAWACASVPEPSPAPGPDPRLSWFGELEGTWRATEESSRPGLSVTYRRTAAGTVVLETIAPGSADEMVSAIRADGPRLVLDHYCVLGNQPRLRAAEAVAGAEPRVVSFRCGGEGAGTNMAEEDLHMHALEFTFLGEDHVRADWRLVEAGELVERRRLDLVRIEGGRP